MSKTSILIRDMEMPASCIECRFGREVNYSGDFKEKCLINDKCGYVSVRKPRLHTCPLISIPTPHGRLIDADEIEYENWYLEETGESYKMVSKDDIDGMSAIIEAEGREE